MQVKNDSPVSSFIAEPKSLDLKKGSVLQAVVKERLPNNEALLQVKGQDIKVKVDGELPKGNRVSVEVSSTEGALPTVKAAAQPANAAAGQETQAAEETEALLNAKGEAGRAVSLLGEKGIAVSRQEAKDIAAFMNKSQGSFDQKMETLAAMGRKGLEYTPDQMKAVHEALHGPGISRPMEKLAGRPGERRPVDASVFNHRAARGQSDLKEMLRRMKAAEASLPDSLKKLLAQSRQISQAADQKILEAVKVLQDARLLQAVKEMLSANASIASIADYIKSQAAGAVLDSNVLKSLNDGVKLEEIALQNLKAANAHESGPSIQNSLQTSLKAVQKNPDIQAVLSNIKAQLPASGELTESQIGKLEEALEKAGDLADKGRELAARQELMKVLDGFSKETDATAPGHADELGEESLQLSEEFISSLPAQSKDFIVTEITKKMSQLSIDFKQIKRDIGKNLQTVEKLIDQFQNRAVPQAKPLLENTIKQLDNAILKSDVMLYTDMSTEKKLLKASTQLAEAKRMLEKGEVSNASRVVSEVRNMVDKLIFKPSDVRVQHFVSKQLLQLEQPGLQQLAASYENSLHAVKEMASGRQILEHMRNLGLTYESDQAQALVQKGKADADSTLKGAMLKLMQNEGDHQMAQKADQLTANLTGQQLLSKSDPSGLQTMMLTIPYLLQDKAEDVKVFIQSKNNEEQIDWENCSLYFLLETKKLGDVGILLSAVDRTLSLTIKNDSPAFKEKIEPLAVMAQDKLKEIGYNVGKIQFTPFTAADSATSEKEAAAAKTKTPGFSERGYDFTI
ncbi:MULTISPECIES: hypothetical protein [Bacillaceae]|uniref:hypothetical protein n=1 Tax=Bacillaceae TaxID=186817 RepID=UPI00296410B4|nr:hypothetical protein [Bacillus infantis]MDW2876643.1 hypothetical protein [Bacillus infantis]